MKNMELKYNNVTMVWDNISDKNRSVNKEKPQHFFGKTRVIQECYDMSQLIDKDASIFSGK